jgi:hypothetical protein
MEQQVRDRGSVPEEAGAEMQSLVTSVLSGHVWFDEAPAHPPHPHVDTTISPIHYISQSALSALGLGVPLLRFGTSPLCQTGAMMVSTEFPLGVNVVD